MAFGCFWGVALVTSGQDQGQDAAKVRIQRAYNANLPRPIR